MKAVYLLSYGCYFGMVHTADVYSTLEQAEQDAYALAMEETRGWEGSGGFNDDWDELLEEGYTEEQIAEIHEQAVEDNANWSVELFDPSEDGEHYGIMYDGDFKRGVELYNKLKEESSK